VKNSSVRNATASPARPIRSGSRSDTPGTWTATSWPGDVGRLGGQQGDLVCLTPCVSGWFD
jgi:hypothetical protein